MLSICYGPQWVGIGILCVMGHSTVGGSCCCRILPPDWWWCPAVTGEMI